MDPRSLPPPPAPCQPLGHDTAEPIGRLLALIDELRGVDENWPLTPMPAGLVCADFLRALGWPHSIVTNVLGFDVVRWAASETVATVRQTAPETWDREP